MNYDVKLQLYAAKAITDSYQAILTHFKQNKINQLKENFRALVGQYKSGKQEIFELSETTYAKHYEKAFRELFSDTGYQATVGEVERLGTGNKKSKKLYITLPICYN